MIWESIRCPWASTTSWNCIEAFILARRARGPTWSRAASGLSSGGQNVPLRACQKDGQPHLVGIDRPVPFRVVHCVHIDASWAELRVWNRNRRIATAADGHHHAMLSALDAIHCHSGKRRRDHLVKKIRIAAAQVISQIADDGFFFGALLDFIAQVLAYVGLLTVAVGVGLAGFTNVVTFPLRAF